MYFVELKEVDIVRLLYNMKSYNEARDQKARSLTL